MHRGSGRLRWALGASCLVVCCAIAACTASPRSLAPARVEQCAAVDWIAQHHGAISSLDARVRHVFAPEDRPPYDFLTRLVLDRSGRLLWERDQGGIRGTEGEMVGHGEGAVGEGDDYIRSPMPVPTAMWMLVDGERARDFTCVPAEDAVPVAGQVVIDLSRTRADGVEERARVHVIAEGPLRGRVATLELRGSWWTRTFYFSPEETTVNPVLPSDFSDYHPAPGAIDRTAEYHPSPPP